MSNILFKLSNSSSSFFKPLSDHFFKYPTPINLNYSYSFGSLAGLYFFLQIITGALLAMHYVSSSEEAFNSVVYIMQEVNYGWLMRYMHMNGASMIFIFLYCHIGRGIYYQSYLHNRITLWYTGILILLLMMATAFIGYVLPWGQMSLWGATVITNFVTAIPYIGEKIVHWVWGGYSVSGATLTRFYSLHYLLPFIILGLIISHLILLHQVGSTNPSQISSDDKVTFHPYFTYKDAFAFNVSLIIFVILVFFYPNLLGHPDNYIKSNPLITPAHIVPEWYFTPFYAILRTCSSKLGGVISMLFAILILFLLPLQGYGKTSTQPNVSNSFGHQMLFWLFAATFLLLIHLGGKPATAPYITLSRLYTAAYFSYMIIIIGNIVDNLNVRTQNSNKIVKLFVEINVQSLKKMLRLPLSVKNNKPDEHIFGAKDFYERFRFNFCLNVSKIELNAFFKDLVLLIDVLDNRMQTEIVTQKWHSINYLTFFFWSVHLKDALFQIAKWFNIKWEVELSSLKKKTSQMVFALLIHKKISAVFKYPSLISSFNSHRFHVLPVNSLPFLVSIFVATFLLTQVFWWHNSYNFYGATLLKFYSQISFFSILFISIVWAITILKESSEGSHVAEVKKGLELGFWLFLLTEIMLFVSFFWTWFYLSTNPSGAIGSLWPSAEIIRLPIVSLPLYNTIILLCSAYTITLAHRIILKTGFNYEIFVKKEFNINLLLTILLGVIFLISQYFEYKFALSSSWSNNSYWSCLYLLTGFHGLHVLIGTLLLLWTTIRSFTFDRGLNDHAKFPQNSVLNQNFNLSYSQHLGFEIALYYWHFVDFVWLFLWIFVYLWTY